MKNILEYTEEELVSADFRGNPHSSIVDSGYTRVVGTNCAKDTGLVRQRVGLFEPLPGPDPVAGVEAVGRARDR